MAGWARGREELGVDVIIQPGKNEHLGQFPAFIRIINRRRSSSLSSFVSD